MLCAYCGTYLLRQIDIIKQCTFIPDCTPVEEINGKLVPAWNQSSLGTCTCPKIKNTRLPLLNPFMPYLSLPLLPTIFP
jgi:hypothetical protein